MWITNRMSQVADQSMSVSITLSDIGRQGIRNPFCSGASPYVSLYCLRQNDQIWHGNTHREEQVSRGQPCPPSKGMGSTTIPNVLGPLPMLTWSRDLEQPNVTR